MTTVDVAFASTYWHRHEGITFKQESLSDPAQQLSEMRLRAEHLHHLRSSYGLATSPPGEARPVVAGYGTATISMIFGCRGVFNEAFDPYAEPLDLDDEAVMALKPVESYDDNPVILDLLEQARWLKQRHGRAVIAINMQSVPNIAFKVRGDQLMYDFYENPELVHHLVKHIQREWIAIRTHISKLNQELGWSDDGRMVRLDNCTVALTSPDIYREFFYPADCLSAKHLPSNFGIHHCGDNMHLFADTYAALGPGVWYDIGFGSEIDSCMSKFQSQHLQAGQKAPAWSLRYGPVRLRHAKPDDIRADRERLVATGAEKIICVGTDPDTPKENLEAFLVG